MSKKFERSLERATDSTLLEPDWEAILDCVDQIRAGEVQAKYAIPLVRKKMMTDNPHSALHALLLLDACVKNCGSKVHTEIATQECMEEFRELVTSKYEPVKAKALEMLQCWAMAFVSQPAYKTVVDTHNLLKLAGFTFPLLKDPETMYIAQVAPEWVDGNECFRCRSTFGLLNRKHHCRACGQIFCYNCSSKTMMLPHLGIENNVRVCDACYEKGPNAGRPSKDDKKKDAEAREAASKKEKELREKEEEELQLAIAISQSEAEAKDRERKMYSLYNGDKNGKTIDDSASIAPSEIGYRGTAPSLPETESSLPSEDPLAKYLNRDYWQKKTEENSKAKVEQWDTVSTVVPGAPPLSTPASATKESSPITPFPVVVPSEDQSASETLQFCEQIKQQVYMMDSRIRSNAARGRSIVNDSALQALFEQLTNWHAEVLARMTKLDEHRANLESLQDHLAHIGEARQAMDALREEHERQMREEEENRRRMKQAVMANKLELMRAKKHELLLNQRHLALQRFQQNEMAHRMGAYGVPGGMVPPMQGVPPQGMHMPPAMPPPPQSTHSIPSSMPAVPTAASNGYSMPAQYSQPPVVSSHSVDPTAHNMYNQYQSPPGEAQTTAQSNVSSGPHMGYGMGYAGQQPSALPYTGYHAEASMPPHSLGYQMPPNVSNNVYPPPQQTAPQQPAQEESLLISFD